MAARRHVCRYLSSYPVEAQFLLSPQASQFQNIAPQVRARETKNTINLFPKKIWLLHFKFAPQVIAWYFQFKRWALRNWLGVLIPRGHLTPSSDFFFVADDTVFILTWISDDIHITFILSGRHITRCLPFNHEDTYDDNLVSVETMSPREKVSSSCLLSL